MPEPTTFQLRYHGRDVDNGTMPIDDVAEALEGFSGAYTKIAAFIGPPDAIHQLRVSATRRGSFEIAVLAIALSQYSDQLQTVEQIWNFATHVCTRLST